MMVICNVAAVVCHQVVDGRPVNTATGTRPCVVHANGWDKQPLLALLERCGLLEDAGLLDAVKARRENLEKTNTLQTREKVGAPNGSSLGFLCFQPQPAAPVCKAIKMHHVFLGRPSDTTGTCRGSTSVARCPTRTPGSIPMTTRSRTTALSPSIRCSRRGSSGRTPRGTWSSSKLGRSRNTLVGARTHARTHAPPVQGTALLYAHYDRPVRYPGTDNRAPPRRTTAFFARRIAWLRTWLRTFPRLQGTARSNPR